MPNSTSLMGFSSRFLAMVVWYVFENKCLSTTNAENLRMLVVCVYGCTQVHPETILLALPSKYFAEKEILNTVSRMTG
jgi:hypothetical protein